MKLMGKTALAAVLAAVLVTATACSAQGGKQEEQPAGGGAGVGKAGTPRMKFAMITHAPPGDTFFDIIRKGADAAAQKDNVEYSYAADVDPGKQSVLIQNAIDSKAEGIAVAMPAPDALLGVLKKAVDAGIPVVGFNAGYDQWKTTGALMYFGQAESIAGEAAGDRLTKEGAKKVLCVVQEQGQSQLEARCEGVKQGFTGGSTEKVYVTGTDLPSVRSTVAGKLRQDKAITHVITLGAPFALVAVQALKEAGSSAKVVTFDTNAELVGAVESGDVQWAIDQQPYLQGYFAIDALWLYKTNGNIVGGGEAVFTGPSFVDKTNIATVSEYAKRGTR
jgi:simple sugar transport system substrate-binding protein